MPGFRKEIGPFLIRWERQNRPEVAAHHNEQLVALWNAIPDPPDGGALRRLRCHRLASDNEPAAAEEISSSSSGCSAGVRAMVGASTIGLPPPASGMRRYAMVRRSGRDDALLNWADIERDQLGAAERGRNASREERARSRYALRPSPSIVYGIWRSADASATCLRSWACLGVAQSSAKTLGRRCGLSAVSAGTLSA